MVPRHAAEVTADAGLIVAGGTALQLDWGPHGTPGETLVDISRLSAARGITPAAGHLRIGALETLEACRTNDLIRRHAPILAQACAAIGALGVRTLGTLGGNIGWRQGDAVPALLALGARVEGATADWPLAGLLAAPTVPLMLAVHLPLSAPGCVAVFEKTGHRAAFSPSVITVAGWLRQDAAGLITEARLAVSGASLAARRLPVAETLLTAGIPDWTAIAASIAADIGGSRGTIAARVLTGRLQAALPA